MIRQIPNATFADWLMSSASADWLHDNQGTLTEMLIAYNRDRADGQAELSALWSNARDAYDDWIDEYDYRDTTEYNVSLEAR